MAYKNIEDKKRYAKKWYRENKEHSIKLSTEWRKKNRERYLESRKRCYQNNLKDNREKAKIRSKRYYYEVVIPKRKANLNTFRELDKIASAKRLKKRRDLLLSLKIDAGGKCSKCGYADNVKILQFHHFGDDKNGDVSSTQGMKDMVAEAKKCKLLCPNCHALTHIR